MECWPYFFAQKFLVRNVRWLNIIKEYIPTPMPNESNVEPGSSQVAEVAGVAICYSLDSDLS